MLHELTPIGSARPVRLRGQAVRDQPHCLALLRARFLQRTQTLWLGIWFTFALGRTAKEELETPLPQ